MSRVNFDSKFAFESVSRESALSMARIENSKIFFPDRPTDRPTQFLLGLFPITAKYQNLSRSTIAMLLQIVYVIVTRMTMFMIYIKWDQNQRKLATYVNNNYYTSVTNLKVTVSLKRRLQKDQTVNSVKV